MFNEEKSDEDNDEFLMRQRGFTLIAVAYFKNPVNIWVPSSLSKLQMQGVSSKLISSSSNASYFAKECGIFNSGEDEEYEAKVFYEKGSGNKMWLESRMKATKVLYEANKMQKYFTIDSMVNLNIDTLLVSNKPEDKASLSRAHLSVAKLETANSSIVRSSSILISNRGFLDINNLFSHASYIEEATNSLQTFS
jgi:hypothetical protein